MERPPGRSIFFGGKVQRHGTQLRAQRVEQENVSLFSDGRLPVICGRQRRTRSAFGERVITS
jgi:hypothetical protein